MTFDTDESVTGLIKKPPPEYIPPARYVSKFRNSVRSASVIGRAPHKTLGVPNVSLKPPTEFLRKRSRSEVRRDVEHKHYHIPGYQHKLPSWEKVRVSGGASGDVDKDKVAERDFKKRNIDNAKSLEPLKPRMYYVDDRRGSSHPLVPSGLYPLYRDKRSTEEIIRLKAGGDRRPRANSRQVVRKLDSKETNLLAGIEKATLPSPKQSEDRKSKDEEKHEGESEEPAQKEEKVDTKVAGKASVKREVKPASKVGAKSPESDSKPSTVRKPQKKQMCRYISEEERAELLYGMKKKYEEIMHKFQCLPFLTDTPAKAKRKSKMEEDLKQLEKDIDLIERHPNIYVYEGDE